MKELPTAVEHEKCLLSAMLLNGGEKVAEVAAQLTAEDFYRPDHREIFKAIIDVYNATTEPLTPLLVIDELKRNKARVDRAYFFGLMSYEFTTARNATHIKQIKETARLRKLIDISEIVADEAFAGAKPAAEIQARLEKLLFDTEPDLSQLENAGNIVNEVFKRAIALSESNEMTGVPTGFYDFDKVTNGLQKSDLIFLAARPSMGKTALALNIALNAARKKKSVALFSLEMSKSQIGARLLSSISKVPVVKINSGKLNDAEKISLADALERMDNLPLSIDDTGTATVGVIRAKAKKFQREHGLDLIVIDYVQLMVGDRNNPNRVQEVSDISRNLKGLAKYFDAPVLALSQLNRGVEIRADKRPQLSDLRESGSLEQDADIVMFLYRDEYYTREECETPNVAELIIAKNRNGATRTIGLHFDKETTTFADLTRTED